MRLRPLPDQADLLRQTRFRSKVTILLQSSRRQRPGRTLRTEMAIGALKLQPPEQVLA